MHTTLRIYNIFFWISSPKESFAELSELLFGSEAAKACEAKIYGQKHFS